MNKYLAILLLIFSGSTFAESVRVQVIDIGQADGIVIRTPSNNNWVVIDRGTNEDYLSKYVVYIEEQDFYPSLNASQRGFVS